MVQFSVQAMRMQTLLVLVLAADQAADNTGPSRRLELDHYKAASTTTDIFSERNKYFLGSRLALQTRTDIYYSHESD